MRKRIYIYKSKLIIILFLLEIIVSCKQSDIPSPFVEQKFNNSDKICISLNVNIPCSGDVSYEEDGLSGNMLGSLEEAIIKSFYLIFCQLEETSKNFPEKDKVSFVLQGAAEGKITGYENGCYLSTLSVEIQYEDFIKYFSGKRYGIYIVANAIPGDNSAIGHDFDPFSGFFNYENIDDLKIGSYGEEKFLPIVSSTYRPVIDFSGYSESELKSLIDEVTDVTLNVSSGIADVFKGIGSIKLERAIARIDIRCPSDNTEDNISKQIVYKLGNSGLYLKLTDLQPFNVSGKSYIFKHSISGDFRRADLIGSDVVLFGKENDSTSDNSYIWIVDYDWQDKKDEYLNSPIFSEGRYVAAGKWTPLSDLFNRENSSYDDGYYPWCYISENTVPSVEKMIHKFSTGVVFRMVLCDEDGKRLDKASLINRVDGHSDLNMIEEEEGVILEYDGRDYKLIIKNKESDNGTVTYFCLDYYYFIRHNDTSKRDDITDPMEFSIVRNNIYQLSIKSVNSLPSPYSPERLNESKDLNVSIQVKPWEYEKIEMEW